MIVSSAAGECRIRFDDEVTVSEIQDLMQRMDAVEAERFAARDIFHYGLRNPAKEQAALDGGVNVTLRDTAGDLLGYMRVVTDGSYIHYIVDVMVDPACQGGRMGSQMVQYAVDELKKGGFIKILLTAIPGKEAFYQRMGFQQTMSPVLALRGEDYMDQK